MKSRRWWCAFEGVLRAATSGLTVCAVLVGIGYSATIVHADDTQLPAVEKADRHEFDDWLRLTGEGARETFNKRNLGILAGTAAGSAVLMFTDADNEIRDFFQRNDVSWWFNEPGNIAGAIGPPLLAVGLKRQPARTQTTSGPLLAGINC